MSRDMGASGKPDRATHERSQQAVSAVPVGIPSAEYPNLAWLFQVLVSYIVTAFVFGTIGIVFGWGAAVVCGLLVLAFAFGVFYGAGSEIRKQADAQGMAARSDATGTGAAEGNSPVPEGDAP